MIRKPKSFVRSWQWNTSWYLNQERRVEGSWKWRESLEERNIQVFNPEDVVSPIHEKTEMEHSQRTETALGELKRDKSHPLWQEEASYTYGNRTWLPKDKAVTAASEITNSIQIEALPHRTVHSTSTSEARLSTLIKNAFIGDALQKMLPRNFKVPYIGWHPVESKMTPRNQYDWQAFSWGRHLPREYGVPNSRKLTNLNTSLVKEIILKAGLVGKCSYSVDSEVHRQFLRYHDGKLMRFYLDIPLSVNSSHPCPEPALQGEVERLQKEPLESLAPMSPLASLHPTNIYRMEYNHPVTSLQHTQPFINTVFNFYDSHIAPKWKPDELKGKALMMAFTVALGQARLRYGADVEGDLPKPVNLNVVTTDGPRYLLSSFQLNTLDLSSNVRNVFWTHPETLNLFEFCGYKEGKVALEGVNLDVFKMIQDSVICN